MTCARILAALLVSSALVGSAPAFAQDVGRAAAVNPATDASLNGRTRALQLGSNVIFRERIATSASGSTQIVFVDRSTLNLGPSAQVTIDEFVYDPNRGTGRAALSLARGALRFVGGRLSKEGAVEVRTPTATIGIRGGVVTIVHTPQGGTIVTLGFGQATITTGGGTERLLRPGFQVTARSASAPPSPPQPASQAFVDAQTRILVSRQGQTGGFGPGLSDGQATSRLGRPAAVLPGQIVPQQPQTTSPFVSDNSDSVLASSIWTRPIDVDALARRPLGIVQPGRPEIIRPPVQPPTPPPGTFLPP